MNSMSNMTSNFLLRNIDLTKLGVCDKGCNNPAQYYCHKKCIENVAYYCQECLEGDDHDHKSISRDKECNRLHEIFMKKYN